MIVDLLQYLRLISAKEQSTGFLREFRNFCIIPVNSFFTLFLFFLLTNSRKIASTV